MNRLATIQREASERRRALRLASAATVLGRPKRAMRALPARTAARVALADALFADPGGGPPPSGIPSA